jgi:hypothetical protein
LQQAFYSEPVVPPSHKSSNNLLAVEPETENDIAQKLFPRHHDFLRLKRQLFATTTRIYSNDQHVETCGDAWCRDDGGNFRWRCTCLLAGTDPGTA